MLEISAPQSNCYNKSTDYRKLKNRDVTIYVKWIFALMYLTILYCINNLLPLEVGGGWYDEEFEFEFGTEARIF